MPLKIIRPKNEIPATPAKAGENHIVFKLFQPNPGNMLIFQLFQHFQLEWTPCHNALFPTLVPKSLSYNSTANIIGYINVLNLQAHSVVKSLLYLTHPISIIHSKRFLKLDRIGSQNTDCCFLRIQTDTHNGDVNKNYLLTSICLYLHG